MSILKIARMGHPVLSRAAEPVPNPSAAGVRRLVEDMMETMEDAGGVGLAAPQVHVPLRLVIFRAPTDETAASAERGEMAWEPLTVLINPAIEILTEDQDLDWEGCLSVPGLRGLVPRYTRLRYTGYGLDGSRIEREAHGFHARVVQHECDHLDGILYPMRMTDLSKLVFESEFRHIVAVKRAPEREAAEEAERI